MSRRVLIIDDDLAFLAAQGALAVGLGCRVYQAENREEAVALFQAEPIDLVLLGLHMENGMGLDLLQQLRAQRPETPILAIAGPEDSVAPLEAMKLGAWDYLIKPVHEGQMERVLESALNEVTLRQKQVSDHQTRKQRFGLAHVIGESPRIVAIKERLLTLAQEENGAVLIRGESGTGKELIARALHYESWRVEHPFMNIVCAPLPANLQESELFGYEKAAYTNARAPKDGLLSLARGGTVFLDEVSDLSLPLQAKLLRLLEDHSFVRVGGKAEETADVRIIAATQQPLEEWTAQQRFRGDLYKRLRRETILLPALRERLEDIPLLAQHFLRGFSAARHRPIELLSDEALAKLQQYSWPGNVRELRNVLERAVEISHSPEIGPEAIVFGRAVPMEVPLPHGRLVSLPEGGCVLDEVERSLLEQALARTHGNQTRAAELLGITRDQVRYKSRKYRLG